MPDDRFVFDQIEQFKSEVLPPDEVEQLQRIIDNVAKARAKQMYDRLQIERETASMVDVLMLMGA